MKRRFLLPLILLGCCVRPSQAGPTPGALRNGMGLDRSQWREATGQFEDSLAALGSDLRRIEADRKRSQKEIESLQAQVDGIRRKGAGDPGVLDDLRLKGLLNDLKERLEKDSALQKEWAETRKDLEQKALSLIALYTDRIQTELEDPSPGTDVGDLPLLIRKRHDLQEMLARYQVVQQEVRPFDPAALRSLQKDDLPSLQMTLGLLKDRQKALESSIEKRRIEADGIRDEIKLQSKMREFMTGLQRMNRDSDAPVEEGKRNELSHAYGPSQKHRLEDRLAELEQGTEKDEKAKDENERLMTEVQGRIRSLGERKRR